MTLFGVRKGPPRKSEALMHGTATPIQARRRGGDPPSGGSRGPVVERIANWSAAHRKSVLLGWLLLVVGAVFVGSAVGTKNLTSYDPGQAGRAERVLARPGVVQRPTETVLIQARAKGAGAAFTADPELRQAATQVVAALRRIPKVAIDIHSPLAPGGAGLISRDGRSALVTFTVAGNPNKADQTVPQALTAIAAVQARHPGLLIGESGAASIASASNNLVSEDFRRALFTS